MYIKLWANKKKTNISHFIYILSYQKKRNFINAYLYRNIITEIAFQH